MKKKLIFMHIFNNITTSCASEYLTGGDEQQIYIIYTIYI